MISKEEQRGDLHTVIVTDIGTSHRLNNKPNQDSALYSFIEEDFVLAVSDGVGSCQKADLGSEKAVSAAITIFKEIKQNRFEKKDIPRRIIFEWKRLLRNYMIDDCCATLKVAMKFNNKLILDSIGDGMLIMTSNGVKVKAPSDDKSFANETRCLSSFVRPEDLWFEEIHLDLHVPYAIFMCTDGIANGLKDDSEYELVMEIEESTSSENLKEELELLVVDISDFSSDDRTLGVVKYERKNAKSKW